jgi:hypothetical protein
MDIPLIAMRAAATSLVYLLVDPNVVFLSLFQTALKKDTAVSLHTPFSP